MSDLEDTVRSLRAHIVDDSYKGIPLGQRLTLGDIGERGWNVTRGDLALPALTVTESALVNNLTAMRDYCARHGAWLAPHGKTTMAPQLFARQLQYGAWAITAATPTQAAIMHRHGIQRIMLANEITEPAALRWAGEQVAGDPQFEFFHLVDSPATVQEADRVLRSISPRAVLPVLLEIGVPGGRAGVRTTSEALTLARHVAAADQLQLIGVEAYEGLVAHGGDADDLDAVDQYLRGVRDIVHQVSKANLFDTDTVIVAAGGSAYFDRVVAELSSWTGPGPTVQLVLRSGCYLTHDAGTYEQVSPLAGRRQAGEDLHLVNALTVWATVLSRPEPELAILGAGKRDLPYDMALPRPRVAYHRDGGTTNLHGAGAQIVKLMDQHAFVHLHANDSLSPGDVVSLDLSHPCAAFDRYQLVPLIDDTGTVIDAVLTFF